MEGLLYPASRIRSRGFTLVELSIVLVIVGLITAAVVGGRSLLHTAKLRGLIKEIEIIAVAYNTFQDKYAAIPGDFRDAESQWGASITDNGDGDGIIEHMSGGEYMLAWQHLSLADMIPADLTGDGSGGAVVGYNQFASQVFDNAGWQFESWTGGALPSYPTNYLFFGVSNGSFLDETILSAAQIFTVDDKIDDGKAYTGRIRADGGCLSGTSYDLANDTGTCWLFFWPEDEQVIQ